jgi:hypothetical protein
MFSKLTIYNGAARLLGQRRLASLTEENIARRTFDDVWDDGLIDYCLGQGQWSFATRSSILDASTSVIPDFGLQYAFQLPSDFRGLNAICYDDYFKSPITEYSLEAGFIYCDQDEIYIKYISNDANYGGDFSLWSETFGDFIKTKLALDSCMGLTKNVSLEQKLAKDLKDMRKVAMNNDLRNKPPVRPASGSWANSRMNGIRNDSNIIQVTV